MDRSDSCPDNTADRATRQSGFHRGLPSCARDRRRPPPPLAAILPVNAGLHHGTCLSTVEPEKASMTVIPPPAADRLQPTPPASGADSCHCRNRIWTPSTCPCSKPASGDNWPQPQPRGFRRYDTTGLSGGELQKAVTVVPLSPTERRIGSRRPAALSAASSGHDLLRRRGIVDALKRNLPPPPRSAAELAQESARAIAAAVSGFPRLTRARRLCLGTIDRPGKNDRDLCHGSPDGRGRGRQFPGARP